MTTPAVKVTNVCKTFQRGKPVLKNMSLKLDQGEMVALIGASGSGKSTLIRTIAGLNTIDRDSATASANKSRIEILGLPMQQDGRVVPDAKALRSRVGVVFQQFNLVSRLSLLTNVLLGLLGQIPHWRGCLGRFTELEKRKAMVALARVGIEEHALKRGSELSGGQQQRAAIARTLLQGAEILIADEPIASLDPSSARKVMDILSILNSEAGITVLVSLHQVEFALRYCPRTVALRDGEVVYDGPSDALTPQFLGELYGAESKELFLPSLEKDGAAPEQTPRPAKSQPARSRERKGEIVSAGAA